MRDFMQIVEGSDTDRDWVINKMMNAVMSGDHWDDLMMRKNDKGELEHWQIGMDHVYDMAGTWKPGLRMDDMEDTEVVETHAFKERLLQWANARYDEVLQKLPEPQADGCIQAHRIMKVHPTQWFEKIRAAGFAKLGIYWTFDLEGWENYYAPWGYDSDGEDIYIQARVPAAAVDWHNTILANMDWMTGDDEHELRVKHGAPLQIDWIMHKDIEQDIAGVKFTG